MSTTPTIALEVVAPPVETQLLAVVEQTSLAPETAKSIQLSFAPLFKQAGELLAQSRAIVVTDASQVAQIKLSRDFRLELRKVRTTGESLRKSLQEDAQRRVKALNGFQHILEDLIGVEETRLDEQEKIVERAEAARKAKLKLDRESALKPFGIDTTFYVLGDMSDEAWAQLLENTQAAHARKQEEARKAEEDRIRQENERLKEEARIREENARLRREADEREAAQKAERERLEAIAAEERRKASEAAETARKERETAEAENAIKFAEERQRADEAAAAERQRVAVEQQIVAEKARAERAKLERKAAEERTRREKLEAEALAAEKAAQKKKADDARAARKAALAPDSDKLKTYAKALRALRTGDVQSDDAKIVVQELAARISKLADWIEKEAETL